MRLASGEVRDLDEAALRDGRVAARWYGELTVPVEGHFMQQVKQAGMESEELVLLELADWLQDSWEADVRYVFGPGSTLHGLASNLGLTTTLLGVDVVENGQVLAHDVNEQQLYELVSAHPSRLLVTAIGGQGHIIGRGNQQISPRVLRAIGLEHLRVVATKRKLATLAVGLCWWTAVTRNWTANFPMPYGCGPATRKRCFTRWAGLPNAWRLLQMRALTLTTINKPAGLDMSLASHVACGALSGF